LRCSRQLTPKGNRSCKVLAMWELATQLSGNSTLMLDQCPACDHCFNERLVRWNGLWVCRFPSAIGADVHVGVFAGGSAPAACALPMPVHTRHDSSLPLHVHAPNIAAMPIRVPGYGLCPELSGVLQSTTRNALPKSQERAQPHESQNKPLAATCRTRPLRDFASPTVFSTGAKARRRGAISAGRTG
jgi:hypothetical protein